MCYNVMFWNNNEMFKVSCATGEGGLRLDRTAFTFVSDHRHL